MNVLKYAQAYASLDWHVLPLKGGQKVPATRHGFKDATTDAATLNAWFGDGSAFNIGVATGAVSGIIVLDIDPRNGGEESFERLVEDLGELPATLKANTGGGGFHVFFNSPKGFTIGSSNGLKAYPGIDVKSDGGYVVAPPSVHPSGVAYTWVEEFDPASIGVADLPQRLQDLLLSSKAKTSTPRRSKDELSAKRTAAVTDVRSPSWSPIHHACDALRKWEVTAQGLPEPQWYGLAGVVAFCDEGSEIFHQLSSRDDRYTEAETDKKIAQAGNNSAPRTCASIKSLGGDCDRCPFSGSVHSPIAFGYQSESLAELQRGWAFIADTDSHVNLIDIDAGRAPTNLKREALAAYTAHITTSPVAELNKSPLSPKFKSMRYLPGEPRVAGDTLNQWTKGGLAPAPGDWSVIDRLMAQLFPNPDERHHIEDVVAYHLQYPDKKIRHALMIRGCQGSGKNTVFVNLLQAMVGSTNHKTVSGDAITTNFTGELANVQVLVIDEVLNIKGYEAANRLKPILAEDYHLFESKHRNRFEGTCPKLVAILSNDPAPLPIEAGDRRHFVPDYGKTTPPVELTSELYGNFSQRAAAYLAYLLERDVSQFDPNAFPPETPAKLQCIISVRPSLEREMLTAIQDETAPFDRAVVIPQRVAGVMRITRPGTTSEEDVRKALQALGAVPLGQLPERPGSWSGKPRAWCVRDHDYWKSQRAAAWAAEVLHEGVPYSLTHLQDSIGGASQHPKGS